jgi:hypothetical protein
MVEILVDVFEKVQLIGETPLGNPPSRFLSLRENLVADKGFQLEKVMVTFIGRVIETALEDKAKLIEQQYMIKKIAAIIYSMPDRNKFLRRHAHAMNIRLFQHAGQQYKIEAMVLSEIQPFLPPTLSQEFDDKKHELEESEKIQAKWASAQRDSPLAVFTLPLGKAVGIMTSFEKLTLPQRFVDLQKQYEAFFTAHCNGAGVNFRWIYEDNMVQMHLAKKGFYDFRLKMPLVFAVVLELVFKLGRPTLSEISAAVAMSVSHVEFLAKRATNKAFPLLIIDPAANGVKGDQVVHFNSAFKSKSKRFGIVLSDDFSLKKPGKVAHVPIAGVVVGPAVAAAPPDDPATRIPEIYQTNIMGLIKNARKMAIPRIIELMTPKIVKYMPFRRDDFDRTLAFLETGKFCQRDPANREVVIYLPG